MSDSACAPSESKPKPCFSNLPWIIKQRIVDYTDLVTRYTTRKVSKSLMHHVDRSKSHYFLIEFELFKTKIRLKFSHIDGYRKTVYYTKNNEKETEYVQRAVKDMTLLLKSPRVTVGAMTLTVSLSSFENCSEPENRNQYNRDQKIIQDTFKEQLNKLNHKLHVRRMDLYFFAEEEVMFILPYLKPKTLEIVFLNPQDPEERLDRLIETDHWKLARVILCYAAKSIPICATAVPGVFMHRYGNASLDELKRLIQLILASSVNPVDILALSLSYNAQEFEEYAQRFPQRAANPRDRFAPVPNTDLFLSIVFNDNRIHLRKFTEEKLYEMD